jgi:hypothetical protein
MNTFELQKIRAISTYENPIIISKLDELLAIIDNGYPHDELFFFYKRMKNEDSVDLDKEERKPFIEELVYKRGLFIDFQFSPAVNSHKPSRLDLCSYYIYHLKCKGETVFFMPVIYELSTIERIAKEYEVEFDCIEKVYITKYP